MINKILNYTITTNKTIEKIVNDDVAMINHMVLPEGECLPTHKANSNVYMIVSEGTVTLELDGTPPESFSKGKILNIEYGTMMSVCNNFIILATKAGTITKALLDFPTSPLMPFA